MTGFGFAHDLLAESVMYVRSDWGPDPLDYSWVRGPRVGERRPSPSAKKQAARARNKAAGKARRNNRR